MALLAGISVDYYMRLEQGHQIVPRAPVIEALAGALGLDEVGRSRLVDLLGGGAEPSTRYGSARWFVRPNLQVLLSVLDAPALLLNRRDDVLALNRAAASLFTDFGLLRPGDRNYLSWLTTSRAARRLFVDWAGHGRGAAENLRFETGKATDSATRTLVTTLIQKSPDFERWWGQGGARQRTQGSERLDHPLLGELIVNYESLFLPSDRGLSVLVWTAEPGTVSFAGLQHLRDASSADDLKRRSAAD